MSKKRIILRVIISIAVSLLLITGTAAIVFSVVPQKTRVVKISEMSSTSEGSQAMEYPLDIS